VEARIQSRGGKNAGGEEEEGVSIKSRTPGKKNAIPQSSSKKGGVGPSRKKKYSYWSNALLKRDQGKRAPRGDREKSGAKPQKGNDREKKSELDKVWDFLFGGDPKPHVGGRSTKEWEKYGNKNGKMKESPGGRQKTTSLGNRERNRGERRANTTGPGSNLQRYSHAVSRRGSREKKEKAAKRWDRHKDG